MSWLFDNIELATTIACVGLATSWITLVAVLVSRNKPEASELEGYPNEDL